MSSTLNILPTSLPNIDHILKVGGIPFGSVIELIGDAYSGKTTFALKLADSAQSLGYDVAYMDCDATLDKRLASDLLPRPKDVIYLCPAYLEEGIDMVLNLAFNSSTELIIADNFHSLATRDEQDSSLISLDTRERFKRYSMLLRQLTAKVRRRDNIVFFINKMFQQIKGLSEGYELSSGGPAFLSYCTIRVILQMHEYIIKDKEKIGNICQLQVIKNVYAPLDRLMAYLAIIYGKGIHELASMVDYSCLLGVLSSRPEGIYRGELRIGGNIYEATEWLRENRLEDSFADWLNKRPDSISS